MGGNSRKTRTTLNKKKDLNLPSRIVPILHPEVPVTAPLHAEQEKRAGTLRGTRPTLREGGDPGEIQI